MSANHAATPEVSALAQAAAQPLAPAAELAERFPLSASDHRASDAQRQQALEELRFGTVFSDHMAHAHWSHEGGWSQREVVPFAPLTLSPAAAVFHYGQEVFEGIKAYRHEDGSIWTFRPGYNAARLAASCRRLCLPELEHEDFVASIASLVRADNQWVPSTPGSSLYLRPFMIASEAFLGVRSSHEADYYVIASPVGPYFGDKVQAVDIWVTTSYHRAGVGGTGAAKCGGNYAASLIAQEEAYANGCKQVCFLDDVTASHIEELGGMNVFVVRADGSVVTPRLSGTILEGCTRSAIIELFKSEGTSVSEADLTLSGLLDDVRSGQVTEIFACGTAAVVTPIGALKGKDFEVRLEAGPVTSHIHQRLTGIQFGKVEDEFGWMYRLA